MNESSALKIRYVWSCLSNCVTLVNWYSWFMGLAIFANIPKSGQNSKIYIWQSWLICKLPFVQQSDNYVINAIFGWYTHSFVLFVLTAFTFRKLQNCSWSGAKFTDVYFWRPRLWEFGHAAPWTVRGSWGWPSSRYIHRSRQGCRRPGKYYCASIRWCGRGGAREPFKHA